VWRFPVKHFSHGFSLVRREGCHINQQLYALIFRGADDGAGVGMPNEDNVASNPSQHSIKRADIVTKCRQRNRRADYSQSLFLQRKEDFGPTRTFRPSAVNRNDGYFGIKHIQIPI
jgi:hypothetical protein